MNFFGYMIIRFVSFLIALVGSGVLLYAAFAPQPERRWPGPYDLIYSNGDHVCSNGAGLLKVDRQAPSPMRFHGRPARFITVFDLANREVLSWTEGQIAVFSPFDMQGVPFWNSHRLQTLLSTTRTAGEKNFNGVSCRGFESSDAKPGGRTITWINLELGCIWCIEPISTNSTAPVAGNLGRNGKRWADGAAERSLSVKNLQSPLAMEVVRFCPTAPDNSEFHPPSVGLSGPI